MTVRDKMIKDGLRRPFVDRALKLSTQYLGVQELLNIWENTDDKEYRDDIIAYIGEIMVDVENKSTGNSYRDSLSANLDKVEKVSHALVRKEFNRKLGEG